MSKKLVFPKTLPTFALALMSLRLIPLVLAPIPFTASAQISPSKHPVMVNPLKPAKAPTSKRICEEFNLTEAAGPMDKIPARDQGTSGTCYAYAQAGAVDAWRLSNDPPKNDVRFLTSPHALAVNAQAEATPTVRDEHIQKSQYGNSIVDGGVSVREELASVKKNGVCSYEAFGTGFENSSGTSLDKTFWVSLQDQYTSLNGKYLDALIADDPERAKKVLAKGQRKLSAIMCLADNDDSNVFDDMKNVRDFIVQKNSLSALKSLTAKICAGHTDQLPADFPGPVIFDVSQIPTAALSQETRKVAYRKIVDSMFKFKNKQPIMANICSGILHNQNSQGISPTNGNILSECAGHAVLIVGRKRMSDGKCGFIIRNSWGADQDGIASRARLDERGDILVSEDSLLSNLYGLAVLPPRGENYSAPKDDIYKLPKGSATAPANNNQNGSDGQTNKGNR